MKLTQLAPTILITAASTFVFACGSGDDDADDIDLRDAGPTRDAGPPRDGGPVIDLCGNGVCDSAMGEDVANCLEDCFVDSCPNGTEGCECNSTWQQGDAVFPQDDCEASLLCIPFDNLSGRTAELNGPLQSCVKPCVTDDDCGMNDDNTQRVCVDGMEYPGSATPVGRICMDRVVLQDEYCGASRNITPRLTGVDSQTSREMLGCGGDAICSFGVFQAMNLDEGVCLQFCGLPGDPACPADNGYCNPNLFTVTATDGTQLPRGICSEAALGIGSWCGATNPNGAGLTSLCDSADTVAGNVTCVGLGVTQGICMELCDTTATPPAQPCQTVDATNGALYCADGLLTNGGGICMTPNCSTYPDTCDGDGNLGNGRFCLGLTMADGVCADRQAPALTPGTVDSGGNLTAVGQDCQDPADDMSFTRCPEGTACIGTQTSGACLAGCSRTTMPPDTYCEGVLANLGQGTGTATCAEIAGFNDPTIGLCGGD